MQDLSKQHGLTKKSLCKIYIIWPKHLRKMQHEWMKIWIDVGFCPCKLNTPIKIKQYSYLFFFLYLLKKNSIFFNNPNFFLHNWIVFFLFFSIVTFAILHSNCKIDLCRFVISKNNDVPKSFAILKNHFFYYSKTH